MQFLRIDNAFIFFILFCITACSVELKSEEQITTTTLELTDCELVENKYVAYSNILLKSATDFNHYIDEISPDTIDHDRKIYFDEIEINYKYKEKYIIYLEARLVVIKKIHELLKGNIDCNFSNDQSISLEQVNKAQDELDTIINK